MLFRSYVDVVGTSRGKGFQGVVKRHGFGGVGQSTHGQHNRCLLYTSRAIAVKVIALFLVYVTLPDEAIGQFAF